MESQTEVLRNIIALCPDVKSTNFLEDFVKIMDAHGYKFLQVEEKSKFDKLLNCDHFVRKGRSRIFVQNKADIEKVFDIIDQIDIFEADYLSRDMVTVFDENRKYPELIYNGKFEMDVQKILDHCKKDGIAVRILSVQDDV